MTVTARQLALLRLGAEPPAQDDLVAPRHARRPASPRRRSPRALDVGSSRPGRDAPCRRRLAPARLMVPPPARSSGPGANGDAPSGLAAVAHACGRPAERRGGVDSERASGPRRGTRQPRLVGAQRRPRRASSAPTTALMRSALARPRMSRVASSTTTASERLALAHDPDEVGEHGLRRQGDDPRRRLGQRDRRDRRAGPALDRHAGRGVGVDDTERPPASGPTAATHAPARPPRPRPRPPSPCPRRADSGSSTSVARPAVASWMCPARIAPVAPCQRKKAMANGQTRSKIVGCPALGEGTQGEPRDGQHRDDASEPAGRDEAAPLAARGAPHEGADDLAAVEGQAGQEVEDADEDVGEGDDAEERSARSRSSSRPAGSRRPRRARGWTAARRRRRGPSCSARCGSRRRRCDRPRRRRRSGSTGCPRHRAAKAWAASCTSTETSSSTA